MIGINPDKINMHKIPQIFKRQPLSHDEFWRLYSIVLIPCIKDAMKEAFMLKLVACFVSMKEYGSIL